MIAIGKTAKDAIVEYMEKVEGSFGRKYQLSTYVTPVQHRRFKEWVEKRNKKSY